MDTAIAKSISVQSLRASLGRAHSPLVIDVRRLQAFDADTVVIASAIWRDPFAIRDWLKFLPTQRQIAVYCVHGHEISKNVCADLRNAGFDAYFLEGGIDGWQAEQGPTTKKQAEFLIPSQVNAPSKWITRERPKIDRIACPWLIRRFIDPLAEFIYVPSAQVVSEAENLAATPYDIPGVALSHRAEKCSFDAFIDDFEINDPFLHELAQIVRAADTDTLALAPQAAGLLAVSLGLSALYADDHDMLEHGMLVYDALYAWLRSAQGEAHNAALFAS